MTCYPPGFTCILTKDTFTSIEWNCSSSESDEFSVGDENFSRRIVSLHEKYARQRYAGQGTVWKLAKIGTDNCYTKVEKSKNFIMIEEVEHIELKVRHFR